MVSAVAAAFLAFAALFPVMPEDDAPGYLTEQFITNPSGDPVITPLQAENLVRAVWSARGQAGLVNQINRLEEGPAAEFDTKAEDAWDKLAPAAQLKTMSVLVPKQTDFPAYFLAVVTVSPSRQPDLQEGLVFTRAAAAEVWKLQIDVPLHAREKDLTLAIAADGYARRTYQVGLVAISPEVSYAVGLADGSTLACYAFHSNTTGNYSWVDPFHIAHSPYMPSGYYTSLTSRWEEEGCGVIDSEGNGRSIGWLVTQVGMQGKKDPPPWQAIGLAGLAVALGTFGLLLLVRCRGSTSIGAEATVETNMHRLTMTQFLWGRLIGNTIVFAIEAAVFVEVVRWIGLSNVWIGLGLLVVLVLWMLSMLPPWLRRARVTLTRSIAAEPSAVWAVLIDHSNPPLEPSLMSIESITPGPIGKGSRFRQVQKLGTELITATMEISEFQPERVVAETYPELWHPQTYRFQIVPSGQGTLVTCTHNLTLSPLSGIVSARQALNSLCRSAQASMRANLERLDERVTGRRVPEPQLTAPTRRIGRAWALGAGVMAVTAVVSLGGYAVVFGAIFGILLMLVLIIHELGHYAEARRHGLSVRLPFFIPFLGAATMMRQLPPDAATHARIAMAGPLIGTLAVAATLLAAGPTNAQGLILFAQTGALINLVNLLPIGILDGGVILAPVSRWVSIIGIGLAILVGIQAIALSLFTPILLLLAGAAVYAAVARFRRHRSAYYRGVSPWSRVILGGVWLVTALFLAFAVAATGDGMLLW